MLATDITNSNIANPITPSMLLDFFQRLSSRGNLRAVPGARLADDAVAHTYGTGSAAYIEFGPSFFDRRVGGYAHDKRFHNLSIENAQIVVTLHELGHATGAESANHQNNAEALKFSEKIVQNCLDL
ncbi:MAG: hypothetical protein WAV20_02710 [Blastocatellia bacterium]